MITEEWWCHHIEKGQALLRGHCTSGSLLGGMETRSLTEILLEGFFKFCVGSEDLFGKRKWKKIHSVSNGRRLISSKLMRTALSADNLCEVLHRTGSLKLSNPQRHANIRNQHC